MGRKLAEPTIGVSIRLTEAAIDAIEDYRQELVRRMPGSSFSMSDAARIAMLRGIAADTEGDDE